MDSFAVSVVNGFNIEELPFRRVLLVAVSFTIFQTVMPVLGWLAGGPIEIYIRNIDHWIAFIILSYLGLRMVYSSVRNSEISTFKKLKFSSILTQSFATSIDALAVGLSLAVLEVRIFWPIVVIGLTTFIFSIAGIYIGKYSGKKLQRSSEIIGGVILILIGIRILIEHLFIHN